MTKTYKIGNREICAFPERSYGNVDVTLLEERFNLLLEALSDKEGYCGWCDMEVSNSGHFKECPDYKPKQEECKNTCAVHGKSKQPTSLKSEIQEFMDDSGYYHMGDFTIEKLIELIQSHIIKEIDNMEIEVVGNSSATVDQVKRLINKTLSK
jgi:hypothetical protein